MKTIKIKEDTTMTHQFESMNLAPALLKAIKKMNISKPTEVQSETIPVALKGSDLIGIAQTGSGKTLAFALPVLTLLEQKPEERALILAPSREMAQQIFKVISELCVDLAISPALIIGGVPSAKQISDLKQNPKILIATPGRLNDHLLKNKLLLKNVSYIVIDEADRMLDMGFAPQLQNIKSTLRGTQQTLMFSATFSSAVEKIAELFMKNPQMIRAQQSEEPVTELRQTILFTDKSMKNDRLLDELNATQGGVIVFCGNQGSCERMNQYLKEYGYSVDKLHGGVTQGQRNRVIRQLREGTLRIVVATDLLARGIDIPHVDHIINFDLPFQAEDFLHRIGRTARAGRKGNAITFITPADKRMYDKIKPYLVGAKEVKLDTEFDFKSENSRFHKRPLNTKKFQKSDKKTTFDGSKKFSAKPHSKTINATPNFDSPKSLTTKNRNDKYKDVPRSGKGKPSVWKSNNKP